MKNHNVTVKIVTLTKELVDSLLACNITNRKPRRRVIDAYKRDMQAGKWSLTHQGIAVSDANVLIDGQHRLLAAKELGYPPIEVIIVNGLPFETQKYVDQQAKRTMSDVIKIAFNRTFAQSAPAIAGVAIRKASSGGNSMASMNPTSEEIVNFIENHFEEIEQITHANTDRFFAAGHLSALVVCAKSIGDVDKVVEFMHSVISGEMLDRTMPAFHLRNYTINSRGKGGGSSVIDERYNKTHKAITAYLNGEEMKALRA